MTTQPNPLDSLPDADDHDYTQEPIESAPDRCVRRLLPHNIALVEEIEKNNRCPMDRKVIMAQLRNNVCFGYFSFDEKTKTYGKLVAWFSAESLRHGQCWYLDCYSTTDFEGTALAELIQHFAMRVLDLPQKVSPTEIRIVVCADRTTLIRNLETIGFDQIQLLPDWFCFDTKLLQDPKTIDGVAMSLVW